MPSLHRLAALACLATASAVLIATPPAWAGCGCDHPPPASSFVMPPFGSPGRVLTLAADGFAFEPGASYTVDFGSAETELEASVSDALEVRLPGNVPPGPVEIRVTGPGVDFVYGSDLFTALPRARRIQERDGLFTARSYDAAVGADGTLYLALDVSKVLDPMQFAFALHGIALHFDHDDVVIYNADGVDLTLFTLDVEDGAEHQWGSYYGWTVESDSGLPGTFYLPKSASPKDPEGISNVFTYWRHEFYTYRDAHAENGSHAVDEHGYHPDGTLHVDHDSLVIAIQGLERDASDPLDLSRAQPLQPGARRTDVGWLSVVTEVPLEVDLLAPTVESELTPGLEELPESGQ